MSTPDPERRVSIWSVPERWRKLFFAIFSLQTAALIGLAIWYEVSVVAADSVVTVDIVMILTLLYEDYRRKRIERAVARVHQQWQAWNQRRLDAEAAGQPFTEPPPSLKQNGRRQASES